MTFERRSPHARKVMAKLAQDAPGVADLKAMAAALEAEQARLSQVGISKQCSLVFFCPEETVSAPTS